MEEKIGKKSSKTKSTTTNSPPAWALPAIRGGVNDVLNTYNQNQPGLQAIQSNLTGSILPALQAQATDTSTLQPGLDYTNSVLGGNFLNSNPHTTAMMQQAGNDAANKTNATFSLAGRTGSNNHAMDLSRGVDLAENQVGFQNYQNERNLQQQAAATLPALNASQYAGYTPLLAGEQLAGQLPYYGSSSLGTIGSLVGNYGTSNSVGTQPGGWGTALLGGLSNMFSFAPISLSDRRLKTSISKVGEAKDGLGIYEFVYKFDPSATVNRGVMADEVAALRPWAFVPNFRGDYAGVNYGILGSVE